MVMTRQAGEAHGCRDASEPEHCSAYVLSRILDAIDAISEVRVEGIVEAGKAFFKALPENVRLEFNYSKWKYEPPV